MISICNKLSCHIQISSGKTLIMAALLLAFVHVHVFAQGKGKLAYIDSLTTIIARQDTGDPGREANVKTLRISLMNSLKDKTLTQDENNRAWNTLRELEFRKGAYAFLHPEQPKNDTLNPETIALKRQLDRLQDSISAIQRRLIETLEDRNENKATKAYATRVLAGIEKPEVITYLLEHESELQFGNLDPDNEGDETHRTALHALNDVYLANRNWMIFPFLYRYLTKIDYMEIGMINRWLLQPYELKAPWSLLEFMKANALPEAAPVIEFMQTEFPHFKKPKD